MRELIIALGLFFFIEGILYALFPSKMKSILLKAKEFRAKGAEMAITITSTADKEVTVILAEAEKQSQIMKGEGDGQRNKIFADAFGKDPEFFAFYRAMQAYEKALIGGETSLILSPDSEFFKFFGNIKTKLD